MSQMNGEYPKILYRIAAPSESDRIREALLSFYYPEELLSRSYAGEQQIAGAGPPEEQLQHALSFAQQGMAALAIEEDHGRIIGVAIARCVKPTTAGDLLTVVPQTGSHQWAETLRLFAHLEHTGDVCGRFRSRRAYHVFVLAVEPHFRRRAIGQKLMEFQLARGKSLRFRVVSADFTCKEAARIGERVDMRCVSVLSLNQYRNPVGERSFAAPEVDPVVSTYARYV